MNANSEYDRAVTLCAPGKRAGMKLREPTPSPIRIITETALVSPPKPSIVPPAAGDRRPAQERVEAAERADAVSVALAQPHRAGSDDPRLAFPLGRFCATAWRNDHDFGRKMHAAGGSYAGDVRSLKVASGFHVIGSERESMAAPNGDDDLSPEEIQAMRANIFGLRMALKRADELLLNVMPRLPRAMVRLCFDHDEPSPYDHEIIRHGLYRLALHYGHLEYSRNRA